MPEVEISTFLFNFTLLFDYLKRPDRVRLRVKEDTRRRDTEMPDGFIDSRELKGVPEPAMMRLNARTMYSPKESTLLTDRTELKKTNKLLKRSEILTMY